MTDRAFRHFRPGGISRDGREALKGCSGLEEWNRRMTERHLKVSLRP